MCVKPIRVLLGSATKFTQKAQVCFVLTHMGSRLLLVISSEKNNSENAHCYNRASGYSRDSLDILKNLLKTYFPDSPEITEILPIFWRTLRMISRLPRSNNTAT